MNTPLLLTAIALLFAIVAVLLWQLRTERAGWRAVHADHTRLEMCVHHNLRAIRAQIGHAFPEAVAVCNALESSLQARCRVNVAQLERTLITHRRTHNAALLDAAGKGGGK